MKRRGIKEWPLLFKPMRKRKHGLKEKTQKGYTLLQF